MSLRTQLLEVLAYRLEELGVDDACCIEGIEIVADVKEGALTALHVRPKSRFGPAVPTQRQANQAGPVRHVGGAIAPLNGVMPSAKR